MKRFFCFSILLLSACATPPAENNPTPTKIEVSADSLQQEALPAAPEDDSWTGIYQRVVPCADCEGIAVLLRLQDNQSYVLRTRRLPDETQDQKFEGEIQWLDAKTLQLQGEKDFIFRVMGDHLEHLKNKEEALPESFSLLRTE